MRGLGRSALLLVLLVASCGPYAESDGSAPTPPTGDGSGNPGETPPPGSGSDPQGGGEKTCSEIVQVTVKTEALPPDLLFLIDRSSSMGEPLEPNGFTQKWDVMESAVGTLVTDRAERANFGLMMFPAVGETCAPGTVDVTPSLEGGGAIQTTLAEVPPGGGTPAGGSIENALAHFSGVSPNPYGSYLVLVTDGLPNCELDAVSHTLDAIGTLRDHGVETYVLGFADLGDAQVLDQMAAAGGTGTHYPVESPDELSGALDAITTEVSQVTCSYALGGVPDTGVLSVSVGGSEVPESSVDGWSYDPAEKTLTFHGASCDGLRTATDADIHLSYCHQVD